MIYDLYYYKDFISEKQALHIPMLFFLKVNAFEIINLYLIYTLPFMMYPLFNLMLFSLAMQMKPTNIF